MKYIKATEALPDVLVEELQKYIQSGYIYIPAKSNQRKAWGELSGYRRELAERNEKITVEYSSGADIDTLADNYHLSVHAIRKIVYRGK